MGQPMEVQVLSCPQTNEPDAAASGDYRLGKSVALTRTATFIQQEVGKVGCPQAGTVSLEEYCIL